MKRASRTPGGRVLISAKIRPALFAELERQAKIPGNVKNQIIEQAIERHLAELDGFAATVCP